MSTKSVWVMMGACVLAGCGGGAARGDTGAAGGGAGGGGGAAPVAGAYRATYEVPVPAALTAAALYDVPEVEWSIAGANAKLSYKLPRGLVGKTVHVSFAGSVDASGQGTLTGAPGSSTCAVTASHVACTETMHGLLPLQPDFDEIRRLAASEYGGPAQDRVDVANRFMGDPIGIVRVDLDAPAASEPGDDD